MKPTNKEGKSPGSKATKYNLRKRTTKKTLSEISPETSKKKRKIKKKMQKQAVQDNFDDDSMKLKLSNGVISITLELVNKVLGVPLGEEVFEENVKVCGYSRNEDVNQNNLSPAQMKDIIDIGFSSMIGMASEEIPGKIAHFVVDNFDDDSMKLKLSNGVISIIPELVYKVLGVPLGGEDINRMNRLRSQANQLLDTLVKKRKLNLLIDANTYACV
nr:hypothetical protein [Tanacetum cinerariifolium]